MNLHTPDIEGQEEKLLFSEKLRPVLTDGVANEKSDSFISDRFRVFASFSDIHVQQENQTVSGSVTVTLEERFKGVLRRSTKTGDFKPTVTKKLSMRAEVVSRQEKPYLLVSVLDANKTILGTSRFIELHGNE